MSSTTTLAVLTALLSPDNRARSEAEAWVGQAASAGGNAGGLASELLAATGTHDLNPSLRVLAAVILRRSIVASQAVWMALAPAERESVRRGSFELVQRCEGIAEVRRASADVLAAVAQASLGENDEFAVSTLRWAVEALGKSNSAGCELLERLTREAPPCVLASVEGVIGSLIAADPSVAGVCKVALLICLEAETQQQLTACSRVMPRIVDSMSSSTNRLEALRGLCELLEDDNEHDRARASVVLGGSLEPIARAALAIITDVKNDEESRALALALVAALVETFQEQQTYALAEAALPSALRCLAEGDDSALLADQEWAQRSTEDDDDDEDDGDDGELEDEQLGSAAASAIESMAGTHGGEPMLRAAAPLLGDLLRSANSARARRAALISLALIGEACMGDFFVQEFVPAVMPIICQVAREDPSMRVRDAALSCLTQFSTDFREAAEEEEDEEEEDDFWEGFGEEIVEAKAGSPSGAFQARYAQLYVPACCEAIARGAAANQSSDEGWAAIRVGRTAAGALANFCHPAFCASAFVDSMAPRAFEVCVEAMRNAPLGFAARAATAAACVAQCASVEVARAHFFTIGAEMLSLCGRALTTLQQQHSAGRSEHHESYFAGSCLGRCLEALALCGCVGVDMFWPAVGPHFAQALQASSALLASDAHLTRHWLGAASRAVSLAVLLPEAKESEVRRQLAGLVCSRVLEHALRGVDLGVFDDRGAANQYATEHAGCEVVEMGGSSRRNRQFVVLNASSLMTCELAMRSVYELSKSTAGTRELAAVPNLALALSEVLERAPWVAFAPNVLLVITATLTKLMVHEGTNNNLGALPCLLRATKPWVDRAATRDLNNEAGLAALDATLGLLETLSEALGAAFKAAVVLPEDLAVAVVGLCCEALALRDRVSSNVRVVVEQQRALEALDTIVTHAGDAIGYVIKLRKDAGLMVSGPLGGLATQCLSGGASTLKIFALCAAVDVIEHCGAGADGVASSLGAHLLKAAASPLPAVRQAGCYGLGILATRPSGGARLPGADLRKAVDALLASAQIPQSQEEEEDSLFLHLMAHDNALAGLLYVLLSDCDLSSCFSPAELESLGLFLMRSLPMRQDLMEARKVHGLFVDALCAGTLRAGSPLALAVSSNQSELGRCLGEIATEEPAPRWALAVANRLEVPLSATLHIHRRFGADPAAALKAAQEVVLDCQRATPETRAKIAAMFAT